MKENPSEAVKMCLSNTLLINICDFFMAPTLLIKKLYPIQLAIWIGMAQSGNFVLATSSNSHSTIHMHMFH